MRKTFAAGGRDQYGTMPRCVPLCPYRKIPVHAEPRHDEEVGLLDRHAADHHSGDAGF